MREQPLRKNRFKHALLDGQLQLGLWTSLCSPIAAELLGDAGFDWVLVDTEHAPNELSHVHAQLLALGLGSTSPVVRPPSNDAVAVKRLLDLGVQTILVPFVESEAEAMRAVGAAHYPPRGFRGVASFHRGNRYGRVRDYLARAGEEICVLVQIESRKGLAALGDICRVPGVDGIFIGPSDLSAELGYPGQPAHADVQASIRTALAICKDNGKPAGILAPVEADARRYIGLGCSFVAVGSDLGLLTSAADALRARFADLPGAGPQQSGIHG